MEKVTLWYEIVDGQDGSAELFWYFDRPKWREYQMNTGSVETFVGSDIHKEAAFGYDD
jgi:hypothetical protein